MADRGKYAGHEALDPFFEVVQEGLKGLVEGEDFYDTIADDAVFEFLYDFPGWPRIIRGRASLVDRFSGYGNFTQLQRSSGLVVHRSQDPRVVILEYEVHGTIVATGVPYDNRFVSIITIENKKIVHWRDYMDSLAAWSALERDPSVSR
jgi:ketosteroid isomerase-like protein